MCCFLAKSCIFFSRCTCGYRLRECYEIRTRWILREKADCKQSTVDYIGCGVTLAYIFWARMTKAKFACNRILILPIPAP